MSAGATKIPWLNRALNALRVTEVNRPSRRFITVADDTGLSPATHSYYLDMRGKKGLTLFIETEVDGQYDAPLKVFADTDPLNTDPASGNWLSMTETAFSHSVFYDNTSKWLGGVINTCDLTEIIASDINGELDGCGLVKFDFTGGAGLMDIKLIASYMEE